MTGVPPVLPHRLDAAAAVAACGRVAGDAAAPVRALTQLGRAYEASEAFQDAGGWHDRAAARGSPASLVALAHDGHGAARSVEEARRYYERARPILEERGTRGNAAALYTLGVMHYFGRGVSRN